MGMGTPPLTGSFGGRMPTRGNTTKQSRYTGMVPPAVNNGWEGVGGSFQGAPQPRYPGMIPPANPGMVPPNVRGMPQPPIPPESARYTNIGAPKGMPQPPIPPEPRYPGMVPPNIRGMLPPPARGTSPQGQDIDSIVKRLQSMSGASPIRPTGSPVPMTNPQTMTGSAGMLPPGAPPAVPPGSAGAAGLTAPTGIPSWLRNVSPTAIKGLISALVK